MGNLQRGHIYVLRSVNGALVPLHIQDHSTYREWAGCFSAI
ncbi:hypothetical protein [Ralstonia phage P-PSG-11-1]|uniref:Uncharacterized protein n=1 Tax=Ralstonia phage P-PSG-11 TaxID=2652430 RepID=A0A5P8D4Y4_9CAUD|nr:hypothetical protein [Ralstonia phage P-PSG-11]QFP93739.1 hypothetical protein [Ralstonia phage P-PSG-11-1]